MKDYELIDGVRTHGSKPNYGTGPVRLGDYKVVDRGGNQWWCREGLLHREDGPAAIRNDGIREWHIYGKLHREDGPAVIWYDVNGNPSMTDVAWYLNGSRHNGFEKFQEASKCSDEHIIFLKLKYGEIDGAN